MINGAPNGGSRTEGSGVGMARTFIPISSASELLGGTDDQTYALIRAGQLPAIQIGGRAQWRVETAELDAFTERTSRGPVDGAVRTLSPRSAPRALDSVGSRPARLGRLQLSWLQRR